MQEYSRWGHDPCGRKLPRPWLLMRLQLHTPDWHDHDGSGKQLPRTDHPGVRRSFAVHRHWISGPGQKLSSLGKDGLGGVCPHHRQHHRCLVRLLPATRINQSFSLRADHRRRDTSVGHCTLCLWDAQRSWAGQPAPHHGRVSRPPDLVPQSQTHWALRLSADHSCWNPETEESFAQHQGPRLLCTGHPTSVAGWSQAALLSLLCPLVI